jgi:protein-S-isoprenylcysteine O-methyltransferase Ste14
MSERLLAKCVIAAAVICGVGGVALIVVFPAGLPVFRAHWPLAAVLCWDAALSLMFFVQHSGMVRRQFRARLAAVIALRYHGAVYAIASGIALAIVVVLWQPSDWRVLILEGLPRRAAQVCSILAIAFFVWGVRALRGFDPLGLDPIKAYLRGRNAPSSPFVVRGPYRWVRHPLYFAILVLIWSNPDLTADRLLFNVLWSVWICVGARLEETDLVRDFGDAYERYRRKVPILIPWRCPVKL